VCGGVWGFCSAGEGDVVARGRALRGTCLTEVSTPVVWVVVYRGRVVMKNLRGREFEENAVAEKRRKEERGVHGAVELEDPVALGFPARRRKRLWVGWANARARCP
jgi:hypothetical protein